MLCGVLLSLAVCPASTEAQSIVNVAEATWSYRGAQHQTRSNEVEIVRAVESRRIRTYVTGGPAALTYHDSYCAAFGGAPEEGGGETVILSVAQSTSTRAGSAFIFEVISSAANRDPTKVNSLEVTLTTTSGDRETLTIYESEADAAVFVGRIATRRMPPAPLADDCLLGVGTGDQITISAPGDGADSAPLSQTAEVLADPFGVVFDSETGEGVSGAIVTLVDAVSGAPARVFAEDGSTPWPSTVVSGRAIIDGEGRSTEMGPGEFWFPLTTLGTYRLEIEPPPPFSAPSVVSPDRLNRLPRADGGSFTIVDASYGQEFAIADGTPLRIDVPLDRPAAAVDMIQTVSRSSAQPGDALFYTVLIRNPEGRARRGVVLTDQASSGLRLRSDSVRVDGASKGFALETADDGRGFSLALGDIAPNGSRRVSFAMNLTLQAPPGYEENRAEAVDSLGRSASTAASVRVERESIAGRMTIIGRITAGDCSSVSDRAGLAGVRVTMEDGSFAVTDGDGRYHFEGVVPGNHVVQAASATLPAGAEFADCTRSTRSAGSATSLLVSGQGGALATADFHVQLAPAAIGAGASQSTTESSPSIPSPAASEIAERPDWIALGDGPDGWLTPTMDENPRAPAIRVAIRHRANQSAILRSDGRTVDPLLFEGTSKSRDNTYAVSFWRGVPLLGEDTLLTADIVSPGGSPLFTIERSVHFSTTPARAELVPEASRLIADGHTTPIVAIRVLDARGRPMREGVSGALTISSPYESAAQIAQQQIGQPTGRAAIAARWTVSSPDGIALVELAPTMVSGSLQLGFRFEDRDFAHEQHLEAWVVPGEIEWTFLGLVEGSVGARTVAQNMERSGRFDSDLGDQARVALYAKGRVLGRYLVTLAYDSAKQRDDQRVLGSLDPDAYYTVFADASSRRFDAASREKLYVRIETASFYALYGDFETGFDQTRLTRYNRVATGVEAQARFGQLKVAGFAAKVGTRHRRDEIQGEGISGPYRLSSRAIVPNSETVSLEIRDRFRSEIIVDRRELRRFVDYDVDALSGSITFPEPVLSRDFSLNPQFLVVEYEIEAVADGKLNAGARAAWENDAQTLRIGATAISDQEDKARTDMGGIDLRVRLGQNTELRGEVAASRSDGETATSWVVEAQHQSDQLEVLAYARSLEEGYGVGQQSNAELGRRKVGVDARVRIDEHVSVFTSLWQDDSLADASHRRAAELEVGHAVGNGELRLGVSHFDDRLADGTTNRSTVLEAGAIQRLLGNRLELSASTSMALDATESIDLPARHRVGVRYALNSDIRLGGTYEIADGQNIQTRTLRGGVELAPWSGGKLNADLGEQSISELGSRDFAVFGLAQTLVLSPALSIDATFDSNWTVGSKFDPADIVNPEHPVAGGGHLGENGALLEQFTAVTIGATWRHERWSATGRAEYRDGEYTDRKGFIFGAIRQLGEGSIVGSGFTWTRASEESGASSEIIDAGITLAHRPADSPFALLGKLAYRSDRVTNGMAADAGGIGPTALAVDGDAISRRMVASLSADWSPSQAREAIGDSGFGVRPAFGLFVGLRHGFDSYGDLGIGGTSLLGGLDTRIDVGERFAIGTRATLRSSLEDRVTAYSGGPYFGFVPVDGMMVTLGYNLAGFSDPDYSGASNTEEGIFVSMAMKLDDQTLGSLGLGR